MLNVHPSTVARWLSGETRPGIDLLTRLAETLAADAALVYELAGYPRTVAAGTPLTDEEVELLAYFSRLTADQRGIVLAAARGGALPL